MKLPNPLARWSLTLTACAAMSACAPRPVVCEYPKPPQELVRRLPVENLDLLTQFYKSLVLDSPKPLTDAPPRPMP